MAVAAVGLGCDCAIGVSVERVSVAAEVEGWEDVSEVPDVEASSTVGIAGPVSAALDTAGVEVELTKGGAFSIYEPLGCTA